MAIVRSARISVKIKEFYLNSDKEVIVKIVKEILTLFKVEIGEAADISYEKLEIYNAAATSPEVSVKTTLRLQRQGIWQNFERENQGKPDEKEQASVHRLIKLNLYHIFLEELGMQPAPWGILHGVRPTKIIHRYIDAGMKRQAIVDRLQEEFAVSEQKAEMITTLAFKQRPFLMTSDQQTVSIYIGIPFCLSRCLYCSFPAYVLPGQQALEEFWSVLYKDLTAAAVAVQEYGLKVQSIYIGGGTPTSLPEELFSRLLEETSHLFYRPETVEFTVEAGRPDTISLEKIQTMKKWHVNRVSVNPQTMQARTLQRIGRKHSPEDVVRVFQQFREAGMEQINMDVIVGLPGETAVDMEDTIKKIVALHPDDITLHALALKKGSALKMQLDEFSLPSDEEVQKMFAIALEHVGAAGLEPYYLYRQGYMSGQLENIGCSRSGAESMYNIQIMEEKQTILGIGGAATSKIIYPHEKRLQTSFNAKDLKTYLESVDLYIEKRAALLKEAFLDRRNELC